MIAGSSDVGRSLGWLKRCWLPRSRRWRRGWLVAGAEGAKELVQWSPEGVGQGVPGGQGADGAALLDLDQGAAGQASSGGEFVVGPAAFGP